MAKTADELKAEARAELLAEQKRDREAEERKRAEEQRSQGFLDFFRNMFSGFGLFEMILAGLVLGGLYLAAKANPEWAEKLTDMLPESWQTAALGLLDKIGIEVDMHQRLSEMAKEMPKLHEKLTSNGVPKEVVDIIAKDKQTFDQFLSIVSEANNKTDEQGKTVKGKVNPTTFTNANTIYALITKRPEMLQQLAAVALKPGSDAAKSDTGQKIFGALKEIVADEARLNTLLTTHRETTVKLLAQDMKPDALNKIIDKHMVDGKASQELRAALTTMLSLATEGKMSEAKAPIMKLAGNDVEANKAIVNAAIESAKTNIANTPEAEQQRTVAKAIESPEGDKLLQAIGYQKLREYIAIAVGPNPTQNLLREALKPENIATLPQLIAVVSKVPAMTKDLPFNLDALSNLITTTGYKDGKPTAALTKLAATLSASELNTAAMVAPVKDYILSPEVANNPKAAQAVQAFLASVDAKQLTADQQQQLAQMQSQLKKPEALKVASVAHTSGIDIPALQQKFTTPDAKGEPAITTKSAVEALLNAETRNQITTLGMAGISALISDKIPQMTPQNVDVIVKFSAAIGTTKANQENSERTLKVLGAFAAILVNTSPKEAFKDITAKQLSGFFAVPENHNAFLNLLKNVDQEPLDPKQRALVTALYDNMGSHKGVGITNLLKDPKGAEFVLKHLRGEVKQDGLGSALDAIASAFGSDWAKDKYLEKASENGGDIIYSNRKVIKDLNKALQGVTVSDAPVSAPAVVNAAASAPSRQAL